MVNNYLKIKISTPPIRPNIVHRKDIIERLEEGLNTSIGFSRKVTLISAPAGFGKTSLARAFVRGKEDQVAWYSLDPSDSEQDRFWFYLISALQTINEGLGKVSLEMLNSQSFSTESFKSLLTPLLNELFSIETNMFLVLDDYHLIENPQIHKEMTFFIENLPASLHLIITTRSDPPWPLSKWRGKRNLVEIRMRDLQFSRDEVSKLFSQDNHVHLNESQLNILYNKTEGWITGLHLAAISLTTCSSINDFLDEFSYNNRQVLHFLSEEVLSKQPESIQEFLIQTSILNRFTPELCNCITNREDSAIILANLERSNLFVIPLDNLGNWYRYHHLFINLLSHKLKGIHPDRIDDLHNIAGKWFLESLEYGEAVRHFLNSKNYIEIANILYVYYEELLKNGGTNLIIQCLQIIPIDILKNYPLLVAYKLFYVAIRKGREEWEECLEIAQSLQYENKNKQLEYEGILSAVKAFYLINNNNFQEALNLAKKSLEVLPRKSSFWRMAVAVFSGDAMLFTGKPNEAYKFYLEAKSNAHKINVPSFIISTNIKLTISLYYRGMLSESEELIKETLELAKANGLSRLSKVGNLWSLLGELLREKGDFIEAECCIERGIFVSQPEKSYLAWNYLFKISLSFSEGKYSKAIEEIKKIQNINMELELPNFILFSATLWEIRILILKGEFSKAINKLTNLGISEDNQVKSGSEKAYIILARLLLLKENTNISSLREILNEIERLASEGEHIPLLIETLIIKSHLEEILKNEEAAEYYLEQALIIGKDHGYYQIFLNEGKDILNILIRILEKTDNKNSYESLDTYKFAKKLIRKLCPKNLRIERKINVGSNDVYHVLAEDLSPRELQILELISKGLSNQDISEKLFLSIGTVKWHTSNIYGKLGVKGRTQAVALGRKLDIIS